MTELADVHDEIQASGYSFDGYLNTPSREIVLSGTISLVPPDPQLFIVYNLTGGDDDDVQEDMEVEVFSAGGASKGRLRVARGQTITNTVLPINEVSRGRLKPVVGDTFHVYREWRLRDLLIGATLAFPKDSRIGYTNQNALVAPLPLTGGHWAGKCDLGEAYATVPFFGTLSQVMDVDSGGSKTYSWDVKDGTIVTGDATTGDIVVQFPPGKRWVDFTVTDASNGVSRTQHICVIVEDDDNPHIPCAMDNIGGTRTGGWSMTFRVPLASFADIDTLPDGQMIIYHEDEHRAAGIASYGNPIAGRSRIKFIGFMVRESIDIDPLTQTVTFEAVSPLAILSLLPGFSQALLDQASANWQTYPDLMVLAAIVYLPVWHTTLPSLFDLDISGADDYLFPELFIQQNTPYLQVMELVDSISGEFVCDRAGRFFVQRKLSRSDNAARNSADVLLTLTAADVVEIRVTREHRYKSAQLEGRGFTQGANGQPILSVAPGEAPAEAPDFTSLDRQIVEHQSELNDVTGWAYAEENSLYFGAPVPAEIELVLRGGYDVGDFYKQWIVLDQSLIDAANLSARALNRYQVTAASRLLLQAVDVALEENGSKVVTWTCSHETDGEEGTKRNPDQDGGFPDWDLEFPSFDFDPNPQPGLGLIGRGTNRMAALAINGLVLTEDFQTPAASGGPNWSQYFSWSSLSLNGQFLLWVPNGFDPGSGWVITSTRVYYFNIATQTLTSKHTFANTTTYRSADASFGVENHFVVISYIEGVGVKCLYTTDNSSFSEITITSNYTTTTGVSALPGCFVSSRAPGKVITSAHTNTAAANTGASTSEGKIDDDDFGASFATLPGLVSSVILAQGILVPWNNNPGEGIIYYGKIDTAAAGATDNQHLYRNTTDVSPSDGARIYGLRATRDGLSPSVANRLRMLFVGQRSASGVGAYNVFLSNDGGDSWAALDSPGTDYRRCALSGDDPNTGWLWGVGNAIAQIAINGNSAIIDSRTGNLTSLNPGEIIAIAGW